MTQARRRRVHLVDPSAFTPPYDRALAAAIARAGEDVTLVTSRFAYGDVPPADGYAVDERFYRRAGRVGAAGSRARLAAKLAEHVPDMLAYRRGLAAAGAAPDVVHFQWLTVQPLDVHLLPRGVPTVLTAHDVLPREPRAGQLRAQRRLYERVDHVVVHSEHGARRLTEELGLDRGRVTVIPHGAFTHLAALDARLPPELPDPGPATPVVALPGLLRPYKGVEVLLDAWRRFGADPPGELWIVGLPRMPRGGWDRDLPSGVRLVPRFVADAELAGVLRRADLVTLPYREIDQSGVLYAALGLGRPLLLSAVGGFPEVARTGAAELVAPGDPAALHAALAGLLADPDRRATMALAARHAAETTYNWDAIAQRHRALYGMLDRS